LSSDGLRIQLKRGLQSESRFEFQRDGYDPIQVSLFYNRRFKRPGSRMETWTGSYTASFDPDYSVAISQKSGTTHWLHFDAKYRADHDSGDQFFTAEQQVND